MWVGCPAKIPPFGVQGTVKRWPHPAWSPPAEQVCWKIQMADSLINPAVTARLSPPLTNFLQQRRKMRGEIKEEGEERHDPSPGGSSLDHTRRFLRPLDFSPVFHTKTQEEKKKNGGRNLG
ncbi:hypothetical protein NMG60_11008541 [Bertholletia excelsa]